MFFADPFFFFFLLYLSFDLKGLGNALDLAFKGCSSSEWFEVEVPGRSRFFEIDCRLGAGLIDRA